MNVLGLGTDRGGWNNLEPVLRHAQQQGDQVNIMFGATCARLYESGQLPLMDSLSGIEPKIVAHVDLMPLLLEPDILVMGAAQSEEGALINRAAYEAWSGDGLPEAVLVEDYFGSAWPTIKAMGHEFELHVCVGDITAKDALMDNISSHPTRFHLSSMCQVHVTGHPQYDHLGEFRQDWDKKRRYLRRCLGFHHRTFFILIAGQLNGTSEAMQLVEEAIGEAHLASRPCQVLVAKHPFATPLDGVMQSNHELFRLKTPLAYLSYLKPASLDKINLPSLEHLLAAVEIVVSGDSAILRYGALLGLPGVVSLGTPAFKGELWWEKKLLIPPEVQAKACHYAETATQLANIFLSVYEGKNPHLQGQQKLLEACDGHATERVYDVICQAAGR